MTTDLSQSLRANAREADRLHAQSRQLLIDAVRAGSAAGLSQRQISEAIGRSQPEVSRLLRFHGRSTLGRAVENSRRSIVATLASAGARNVHIFGSVARGDDAPGSDVDFLVDFTAPPSLFELSRIESQLERILGVPVDVVPRDSLRANLAERALGEAVPL